MGKTAARRKLGSAERTVTPLYHQVYLALRQKILNGECDPKIALPGEHQLAAKYGVSRVTVRRTLEALELERARLRAALDLDSTSLDSGAG